MWSNKWGDDKPNLSNLNWGTSDPISDISKATPLEVKQSWTFTKQLTLYNGNKQYTFTAEIVGDLALDFTPDGQPNAGWNIYHVPTLACFSKAVPATYPATMEFVDGQESFNYSREALLTWMAKVQKNYPSWTMLRLLTPANYSDSGQSAKDIILKWCLSVPVVEE